ncbi:MAG: serine hydrolase domain-containing protein [Bacteroidales bacterium]
MKSITPTLKILLAFAVSAALNAGCENSFADDIPYRPPVQTVDGIAVGTMDQVAMDTQAMATCLGRIYANKYDQVHSILVYKDGLLVFEEYMEGNRYGDGPYYYGERIQWHRDSLHFIMSCTKSVTSALIGIAVEQGAIDLNESIFAYLPDHRQFNRDGKEAITVEHLLTMTAGLAWDEWGAAHGTSANDIDRIYLEHQKDPLAGILSMPLVARPGTVFNYSGGNMIVLGEILRNATGRDILDFGTEYLFGPLGIRDIYWHRFENGAYACDGAVLMTPRDMLKIGITFLDNGTWKGEQLISPDWVEKSRTPWGNNTGIKVPLDDTGKNGYGYTWWTNRVPSPMGQLDIFQASGWGGQEIIVIPGAKMVVVFTGGNYAVKKHIHEMLTDYILGSLDW